MAVGCAVKLVAFTVQLIGSLCLGASTSAAVLRASETKVQPVCSPGLLSTAAYEEAAQARESASLHFSTCDRGLLRTKASEHPVDSGSQRSLASAAFFHVGPVHKRPVNKQFARPTANSATLRARKTSSGLLPLDLKLALCP